MMLLALKEVRMVIITHPQVPTNQSKKIPTSKIFHPPLGAFSPNPLSLFGKPNLFK